MLRNKLPAEARSVIFDLDGTLIDSESYWRSAFSYGLSGILAREGYGEYELSPDEMIRFQGGRVRDSVPAILAWLGLEGRMLPSEIERITTLVVLEATDAFRANPRPISGAVETARELYSAGISLGLASSSAMPFIDAVLSEIGLLEVFGVRLSANDLPVGKPDPAIYTLAMNAMRASRSHAVAIEDSEVGVASALGAGLRCIWYSSPDEEKSVDARLDAVVRQMATPVERTTVSENVIFSGELSAEFVTEVLNSPPEY